MRLPQPQELVAAAREALGARTDDDLAHELRVRYGLRPTQSIINRWVNGKTEPSYPYVLALLDAAGWLSEGRAADEVRALEPPRDTRLEQLADGLAEVLRNQQEALELLRGNAATLGTEAPASPRRKAD